MMAPRRQQGLRVSFSAPVSDHAASHQAGTGSLGAEEDSFWRDQMGAGVNAIRTSASRIKVSVP